ncbi:MAG: UDP-3-O-[3-hydroxymyristoyl] N-acetylglucosamine deacetylase [Deltaproteobacteria bacterium]|nr:UDP-3-O-[3-hydroxymyristoyl] N-acetylglucosamine deacetylase [Deltaproteobacteria bacterium]
MWQQRTLKDPVRCIGLGLHSGQAVTMTLRPAPPERGIIFRRVDLPGQPEVSARVENVIDSRLATTLAHNGARVMSVEHLLGPEVPIMDGSCAPFLLLIKTAGIRLQEAPRRVIRIKKAVKVGDGDRALKIAPSDKPRVSCVIKFDHHLLKEQKYSIPLDVKSFTREISRARTFGFLGDVAEIKKLGLSKGGSLDNVIVIDRFQVLNPTGLRFEDEFVRHKILDMIGDLALLGRRIIGHLQGFKPGHSLNHSLVRRILESPAQWEILTLSPETSPAVEGPVAPQLAVLPAPSLA